MGINAFGETLIADKINGAEILCLGYPDILSKKLSYTPTIKHRLVKHGGQECIDTEEYFRENGAKSVRYIDTKSFNGVEDIVDLNYPHELGQYDLVIDPGTLEHCWNVGQAWMNAANAVKEGGYIYHNNPLIMINHGFWSFNPTVYHDFYSQNGFECEMYIEQDGNSYKATGMINRLLADEGEAQMQVIAKRIKSQTINYPTQSKYL